MHQKVSIGTNNTIFGIGASLLCTQVTWKLEVKSSEGFKGPKKAITVS